MQEVGQGEKTRNNGTPESKTRQAERQATFQRSRQSVPGATGNGLPGQRHGFGDMTEYFFWKMGDHFSRYLIGDFQNDTDIKQMNNN